MEARDRNNLASKKVLERKKKLYISDRRMRELLDRRSFSLLQSGGVTRKVMVSSLNQALVETGTMPDDGDATREGHKIQSLISGNYWIFIVPRSRDKDK